MNHSRLSDEEKQALPWVEKYRPQSMDDLVSHHDIISTINRFIDENRLPHLLFYGPPGTGKTSTILACARRLYGKNYHAMVLELNASDARGIDVVREQIKDFAGTRQIFSSHPKLVILDEADAMTNPAQFSLRRVMEKFTRNTRFCLICNYSSKIIPALQSRTTKFRFGQLEHEQMMSKATDVIKAEGVEATDEGLQAVVKLADGDMRKVLNVLQSTSMANGSITEQAVYDCVGAPKPADMHTLLESLLNDPFDLAHEKARVMMQEKGLALTDVIHKLHAFAIQLQVPDWKVLAELTASLADLEVRLAVSTNEAVQLSSFVAVFQVARFRIASAA